MSRYDGRRAQFWFVTGRLRNVSVKGVYDSEGHGYDVKIYVGSKLVSTNYPAKSRDLEPDSLVACASAARVALSSAVEEGALSRTLLEVNDHGRWRLFANGGEVR